jgi:flagellar biosynthetic protein FlhB
LVTAGGNAMSDSMSSEHDRTQPASQFKLSEARKHGQVAKSIDVNSFVMIAAFVAVLMISAEKSWQTISHSSELLLTGAGTYATNERAILDALQLDMTTLWTVLMLPLCVGVIAAILGNIIQTGPVFSFTPLKPKFERLNPVTGFKRVFSKRLLIEAVKSIFKLGVLLTVVYITFSAHCQEIATVTAQSINEQLMWLVNVATQLLFRLLLALLVFALIDLLITRMQFAKQMRMSHRDIKEEVKRREGDPLIRSKIRQLQRENLKQSKSLKRVAEADVLITNPTHFAVALRYVRGEMSAPTVIAKGSERWAQDMRKLAIKNNVPVYERRSLARKLFRYAIVDHPVPAETFVDVARLYADLGAMRRRQTGSNDQSNNRIEASA